MKNPFLIGQDIYLRALEESDVQGNYANWLNDAEICQFNSHHVYPQTKENLLEYVRNVQKSKNDLVLAIILKKTDEHIGNISLQCISYINRSAEFAILIGEKKYCGKGFAKQAGELIIKHGFLALGLNRIGCGTSSDNLPMQKLAINMQMKEEGRRLEALYKNGKYADIIEYGVLKMNFKDN